jgi:hypothetical protein
MVLSFGTLRCDVQVPVEHVVTALVRAKREKESLMRHVRATAVVLRKLYFGGWQSIQSNLNPGLAFSLQKGRQTQ